MDTEKRGAEGGRGRGEEAYRIDYGHRLQTIGENNIGIHGLRTKHTDTRVSTAAEKQNRGRGKRQRGEERRGEKGEARRERRGERGEARRGEERRGERETHADIQVVDKGGGLDVRLIAKGG